MSFITSKTYTNPECHRYTNAWTPSNYQQFIVIVIIIIIILISAFPSVEINANYFPTNPVSALLIVARYVRMSTNSI